MMPRVTIEAVRTETGVSTETTANQESLYQLPAGQPGFESGFEDTPETTSTKDLD